MKFKFVSRSLALGIFLAGLFASSLSGAVVLWSPNNGDINVPAIAANGTMTGGSAATFGALTATTINGNTWTTGTGTLTLAAGKTVTVSNTLRFAGTDSTVMTFPTTSATIARTDAANTFTGTQTIGALVATTVNGNTVTSGTGVLTLGAGKTTTFDHTSTFTTTDGQTYTFPTTSATIARTDAANTFTGIQTLSSPPVITGTVAADQAAAGKVGEYQEVQCLRSTSGASQSFTNASPTVGTWASPPWTGTNVAFGSFACPFNITANAPTGLSTATNYWAVPIDATTFHVATSAANAAAGTFANTSGTTSTANLTSDLALSTTAGLATAVLNLTAGDWDCQGSIQRTLNAATSVTNMQSGINTSSTAQGVLGTYSDLETAANVMTGTNNPVRLTPLVRANLTTSTPYYLVALDTFTVNSNNANGDLRCRRVR